MLVSKLRSACSEFNILKNASHRVVIFNRDRIKFVVVATRATNRDSHHRGADSLQDLVHSVRTGLANCDRLTPHGCRRNVGTGNQEPHRLTGSKRITCNLFFNKSVVSFVVVEGVDDVVAIDPSVLAVQIGFGSIGLGPANHIEPMLRPALAKVR